ncbi:MAG: cobyrinate a,c-diamide synthase [Hyphomicrobiales bacterium]
MPGSCGRIVLANGFVIAAPSSGSGKTLVTLGLLRALAETGIAVAPAKAGPDYIDPRFHEVAAGADCVNLDAWAMRPDTMRALASSRDGLFIAEGVMGLFDGAVTGEGSTADLAVHLGLPVILVMDVERQAHTVAALVQGLAQFKPDCRIAGLIFNRTGSPRHGDIVKAAVEPLGIPVLGCIPNDRGLEVPSRHLGLVQASEHPELEGFISHAAAMVRDGLDLEALAALAQPVKAAQGTQPFAPLGQRIAIAQDLAFSFIYRHVLDGWRAAGAELVPFSPLDDEAPDAAADAVYLPGGYPELHGAKLAVNKVFLDGLRAVAARDALIFGECGGYMVLGKTLIDGDGVGHDMVGLLDVTTSFAKRKLHLGYRRFTHQSPLPFAPVLRGHEFHYSTLIHQEQGTPLFHAEDAAGNVLAPMGLQKGKVLGSYAHIIDGGLG